MIELNEDEKEPVSNSIIVYKIRMMQRKCRARPVTTWYTEVAEYLRELKTVFLIEYEHMNI